MKTTVVTGFDPTSYEAYAKGFIKTFDKFWPSDVDLLFYTEEQITNFPRGTQRSLWSIDGVRDFIEQHPEPVYHGLEPTPGWTKKEYRANYAWRYDVVKFCRQLFIPDHAANLLPDSDILAWFDADVITYREVPGDFIAHLIGDSDIITLSRERGASDLGFWAVRLTPGTKGLLKAIANAYRTRAVFDLYEWHSGFVFDHYVAQFKAAGAIKHRSLTKGAGHVWFDCEIGRYTDHLKGPLRKKLGYSPERGRSR